LINLFIFYLKFFVKKYERLSNNIVILVEKTSTEIYQTGKEVYKKEAITPLILIV